MFLLYIRLLDGLASCLLPFIDTFSSYLFPHSNCHWVFLPVLSCWNNTLSSMSVTYLTLLLNGKSLLLVRGFRTNVWGVYIP